MLASTKKWTPVEAGVDEVRRHQGGGCEQRHDRHREEELDDQTGDEDRDIHVGRVGQGGRDLGAPGEVRRPGQDQAERKDRQSEARGIEDVPLSAVPVPPQELLAEDADGDHRELQVEPLFLEAEEEVRAQK